MRMPMDQQLARKLLKVGEEFCIPGPFFSYEEIKMGNVNQTYKVNYIRDDGSGMAQIKSYLVQKLNTYAFRQPDKLMENIGKVTDFIRSNNPDRICLHFHHTRTKANFLMAEDGFWRLSNYIPSVTYNNCDNISVVRSAGEAFGKFQTELANFNPDDLHYTIPDFHNTQKRYETLRDHVKGASKALLDEVQPELDYLFSVEKTACMLTDLFNQGKLPLRVTHNDTKINNVLFDPDTGKALVVVDLDTVMPGLMGHDFGDAIRFAANFVEEDSTELDKVGLNLNIFWAFADGFLEQTASTLTDSEADTLAMSCFCLACELATRFLDDYLLGNPYFNIRYEKHNLDRTRCQIALSKDMMFKMDAMNAIVRACVEKYR